MISTFKITALLVVATSLFGFTEYGSQTITKIRGDASSMADSSIDTFATTAHGYVKVIAPPPTGHGYTTLSTFGTVLTLLLIVAAYREILKRLMSRVWPDEPPKSILSASWNFVSMTFCIVVATFGIMMVKNVFLTFFSELLNSSGRCGMFDMFLTSCSKDSMPMTYQLISGIDHTVHSQNVMFMSLLMTAYFIYDIVFNRPNREFVIHHTLCMVCISIYAWTHSFAFYVAVACVTELSTIFLSALALVTKGSNKEAILMIEFCVMFFVSRILLIPTTLLMIWFTETGTRLGIAFGAYGALAILNFYWFVRIMRKVIRVCRSVWWKKKDRED